MPSKSNKSSDCSNADCISAFKKFKKLIDKEFKDADKSDCWKLSKGENENVTGDQYKIMYKTGGKTRYFKPKIHRMWFYGSETTIKAAEDHKRYTVSHLCHGGKCVNPDHLVLESLAVNKSRNVCPGQPRCNHTPQCIQPGHQYDTNAQVYIVKDGESVLYVNPINEQEKSSEGSSSSSCSEQTN